MASKPRVGVLGIDCQNDFMGDEEGRPYGVEIVRKTERMEMSMRESADLPVKNAMKDMENLSGMIDEKGGEIDDIVVSLDSHVLMDSGHAPFWQDKHGNFPPKYTDILAWDIKERIWVPRNPDFYAKMLAYAYELEAIPGHFKIKIWSDYAHCAIGTWGHNVFHRLNSSLSKWSVLNNKPVTYIHKGMNPFREQFGILEAAVPDLKDKTTLVNLALIEKIYGFDILGVGGEASNICVLTSMRQFAQHLPKEVLKKFHILSDCMSPVVLPGQDEYQVRQACLAEMESFGMKIITSKEFLS